MKRIFLILILFLLPTFGATYHLDKSATGTGSGASKTNAYTSMAAIDGVLTYGDTVLAWAGTYNTAMDLSALTTADNPDIVFIAMEPGVIYDGPVNAVTLSKGGIKFKGWNIQTSASGYFLADGNYVNVFATFEGCLINNRQRFCYRAKDVKFRNCLIDFGTTSYPIYFNVSVEFDHTAVTRYYFALFDPASTTYPKDYVFRNTYLYSSLATADLFQGDLPNLGTGGSITINNLWFAGNVDTAGIGFADETIIGQDIGLTVLGTFPSWIPSIGTVAKGAGQHGYDIGPLMDNALDVQGN